MSVFKNEMLSQEYVYDFAVDGGLVSTIELSAKAGYKQLPLGAIVKNVYAVVETAVLSGGSATVAWGNTDVDGYSGTAKAKAVLIADAAFTGNGTLIPSVVVDGAFNVSIAVAALTAGKVFFMVEYTMPGRDE